MDLETIEDTKNCNTQLTGAAEYTECIAAEG